MLLQLTIRRQRQCFAALVLGGCHKLDELEIGLGCVDADDDGGGVASKR